MNFACSHCGNIISSSSDLAGQVVKCPHCAQAMQAPSTPTVSSKGEASDDKPIEATLLGEGPDTTKAGTPALTPLSQGNIPNPFSETEVASTAPSQSSGGDVNPYASPQSVEAMVAEAFGSNANLEKVAFGLQLVYWGLAIALVAVLGGFFLMAAARDRTSIELAVLVLAVGGIIGSLFGLAGRCFCAAIPPRTGARELILTAVVFDGISTVVGVVQLFDSLPPPMKQIASLCSLIASMLFLYFLKRVAGYIQRRDLYERAHVLIRLVFLLFGTIFFMVIVAQLSPVLAALSTFVFMAMSLVVLLRYVRLLVDLRIGITALLEQSNQ